MPELKLPDRVTQESNRAAIALPDELYSAFEPVIPNPRFGEAAIVKIHKRDGECIEGRVNDIHRVRTGPNDSNRDTFILGGIVGACRSAQIDVFDIVKIEYCPPASTGNYHTIYERTDPSQ